MGDHTIHMRGQTGSRLGLDAPLLSFCCVVPEGPLGAASPRWRPHASACVRRVRTAVGSSETVEICVSLLDAYLVRLAIFASLVVIASAMVEHFSQLALLRRVRSEEPSVRLHEGDVFLK